MSDVFEISKDATPSLERLARRVADLDPPLSALAEFMIRAAQRTLRGGKDATGELGESLTFEVEQNGNAWTVVLGSTKRHARIQQFGGEIRPKSGKALAIPLVDWVRRQGVWPRDFAPGELHLVKTKAGKALLMRGDGDAAEALFVLVKRVTIPAKHYYRFEEPAQAFFGRQLARHLKAG